MTLQSMYARAVSLAIVILSLAAPALAQDPPPVTFENIRDAVPGKYFDPATTGDAASPNTLQIGLGSGANAFKACAPSELLPVPCNNTRAAMDTLSFVVRAPEGYYLSRITYTQSGRGAISRLADARGASSWIVGGVPIDLGGPFGGAIEFPAAGGGWTRSHTFENTDSEMTAAPVSLTTGLFAYASDVGAARVELESASVSVEILPIVTTPVKKTATINVVGFTGVYDGDFHGATGSAIGEDGADLSGRLVFDAMFKDVPGGTVHWSFPADDTYNGASGTAAVVITPANATIVVNGFTGTYDGNPHGATGTATGISGITGDLNAHLDLGATFTNVPGGTATWTFGGDPNYNAVSGAASIVIERATPVLTWPAPAAISEGTALSATQLNATANVAGSFAYNHPIGTLLAAGTHTLTAAFTPASSNYNTASMSVSITVNAAANNDLQIVNPGNQTDAVGEKVRLQIHVNAGVASGNRRGGDDDADDCDDERGEHHGGRLKGRWAATGLPAGLKIEDDGEIRGEPTTTGVRTVVVTFTPRKGRAVSTTFSWTVTPKPPKKKG